MLFKTDDFSIKFVSVMRTEVDKCTIFFSSREYNTLSFRLKGEADFITENETFHIKEGDVILFPPGNPYTRVSEPGEVITVRFYSSESLSDEIMHFSVENKDYFIRKFRELSEASINRASVTYHGRMSILHKIFMQMELERREKTSSRQTKIYEIIDYINDNYTNSELSVGSLCRQFGMSDTYLRRLFVNATGVLPIKYINDLRLSYAKELLISEEYSITEIAEKSGFRSTSYFCTFFKKEMKYSPKNHLRSKNLKNKD